MCNKKRIFGTLMIVWRDILCIEAVLDYYGFLVYMYNRPIIIRVQQASTFGTNCVL